MTPHDAQPESARDVAEFVAMLRELKEKSGLTLRGLEESAAAQGEVLARSTAADMLRRDSLPRAELLTAYVKACGVEQAEPWLRARERLATGVAAAVPETPARPAWRRRWTVPAAVVVLALVAAAVVFRGDVPTPPDAVAIDPTTGPKPDLLPLVSAGSWASIHAADAPDLCLTEGRDSTKRYEPAVAALRPCGDPGPRVFLQPVGAEFTTIKWEHPVDKAIGCLTVRRDEPALHLLEPWNHCADDNADQLFRVEQAGPGRYRFRSAGGTACVGLRGGTVREGAEAIREPCADEPDQEFTVDFTPAER
ncbi:hypothetical protein AB0H12_34090 [Actinosynnema sp. NPDC023794]